MRCSSCSAYCELRTCSIAESTSIASNFGCTLSSFNPTILPKSAKVIHLKEFNCSPFVLAICSRKKVWSALPLRARSNASPCSTNSWASTLHTERLDSSSVSKTIKDRYSIWSVLEWWISRVLCTKATNQCVVAKAAEIFLSHAYTAEISGSRHCFIEFWVSRMDLNLLKQTSSSIWPNSTSLQWTICCCCRWGVFWHFPSRAKDLRKNADWKTFNSDFMWFLV